MDRMLNRVRRAGAIVVLALVVTAAVARAAQTPTPQAAGQSDFVVVNPSAQAERIPAAPLLIGAYAFVWVALTGYVWTVWRRVGRVERDLMELQKRLTERGSSSPRR